MLQLFWGLLDTGVDVHIFTIAINRVVVFLLAIALVSLVLPQAIPEQAHVLRPLLQRRELVSHGRFFIVFLVDDISWVQLIDRILSEIQLLQVLQKGFLIS